MGIRIRDRELQALRYPLPNSGQAVSVPWFILPHRRGELSPTSEGYCKAQHLYKQLSLDRRWKVLQGENYFFVILTLKINKFGLDCANLKFLTTESGWK